jgi:hypothetical protein
MFSSRNTRLEKPKYCSETGLIVLTNTSLEDCWQLPKSLNAPLFYSKHKWDTLELQITTQATLFYTNRSGLSLPAHNFLRRWKGERRVYINPRVTIHATSCIDRATFSWGCR